MFLYILFPSIGCFYAVIITFLLFIQVYTQNVIEAVVHFDYCLLLILRSPSSLQELLNPCSGTSVLYPVILGLSYLLMIVSLISIGLFLPASIYWHWCVYCLDHIQSMVSIYVHCKMTCCTVKLVTSNG